MIQKRQKYNKIIILNKFKYINYYTKQNNIKFYKKMQKIEKKVIEMLYIYMIKINKETL